MPMTERERAFIDALVEADDAPFTAAERDVLVQSDVSLASVLQCLVRLERCGPHELECMLTFMNCMKRCLGR